ncbi:anti-sigma factor [Streptomyces sp. NPDC005500]|uniref:anti-sigma factor n=1 Tax=Streptomyces sp. NPDC005500 TaxID=3155007 RepID=UPI0033A70D14
MGKDREIRHLHGVSADEEGDILASGFINDILREEAVWADLPADIEYKVMQELASGRENVVPMRRRPRRPGALSRRRLSLVAASVALLGLGSGIGVMVAGDEPDGRHVDLAATSLAGNSHADVAVRDTPSGVEIKMDFEDLPPAPAGTYYEGWVTGERGMVAIGTFHLREGASKVILWAGVELADYPKMTVTLQKEGGGPASSGRVVLSGHVPDDSQ